MRRASVAMCIALVAVGTLIIGCGELFPLDADLRITRFDPSPVQPEYDEQSGILLPGTVMWVANYSQVPVIFYRFGIKYYEAVEPEEEEGRPEIISLRVDSEFTFFVRGIPTPDPYLPDSMATRQTAELSSIGIQVLTADAYYYASGWDPAAQQDWDPFDYSDDHPIFAQVTIWGKSETGEEVMLEGAANINTLIKKS